MEIRCFTKNDAAKVKALVVSVLKEEFPDAQAAYPVQDLDNISAVYGGQRERFYVIEDGNDIVATVGVKEDSKLSALLRRLFVNSKYRGRGLGSKLVDAAIKFCKEEGYHELVLRSTHQMKQANDLCKKKGFKVEADLNFGGVEILKYVLKLK